MRKYTRCKDLFFSHEPLGKPFSPGQLWKPTVWDRHCGSDLADSVPTAPQFHPNVARKKTVTVCHPKGKLTSAKTDRHHGLLLIACDLHAADAFCENTTWVANELFSGSPWCASLFILFRLWGQGVRLQNWSDLQPPILHMATVHLACSCVMLRRFIRVGQLSLDALFWVCRACSWKCKMLSWSLPENG